MGFTAPIDPVEFAGGCVLPLPGGRCVWRLDALPEDAPEAVYLEFNRCLSLMRGLGHHVVVGGLGELGCAVARLVDEGEL